MIGRQVIILSRKIVRDYGWDLNVVPLIGGVSGERLLKLLTVQNIDLVIDVGANQGQYANQLFELGYTGKVLSFEPLSLAYQKLQTASRAYPSWEVAERCAVGDIDDEIEINVSRNSFSSSILPIQPTHTNLAPDSEYIGTEKVKIVRLDTVLPKYFRQAKAPFLKIDVQGFDEQVLAGASAILPQIKGLQLELSLVELYKGEKLFQEMLAKAFDLGFELHNLFPEFTDEKTGRLMQADAVFFRPGL
ncbi:MAG: FkbM family methyltransferase [Bacteroidetes bacterium]|nr:FkbM family methyltransferase [Bacteroidota bacterium]